MKEGGARGSALFVCAVFFADALLRRAPSFEDMRFFSCADWE